jgi:U3 small nucleolar RNA-associated protein 20
MRSVILLSQTVNNQDFSVIEASFNTLSWLLKYLSRSLILNILSTFDQLAPLLGKTRQKQYVRRFASEAFAFLLRRIKDPTEIVHKILGEIGDNEEYCEAIGNMFVESMKAPGNNLHSRAVNLFDTMVTSASSTIHRLNLLIVGNNFTRKLLNSVLKDIIFCTRTEAFAPILEKILELLSKEQQNIAIDLLLLCCTAKSGVRVLEWAKVSSRVTDLIRSSGLHTKEGFLLVATIIAKSPTMVSNAFTRTTFESLSNQGSRKVGILCELVAKLDILVFRSFVLEEYVKYISHADEKQFEGIMLTILALREQILLQSSKPEADGNPRLGGCIISKKCNFIQWLHLQVSKSDRGNLRLIWRDLRVVETLGIWSPAMQSTISNLLNQVLSSNDFVNPSVVGEILSLLANGNSPSWTEMLLLLGSQFKDLQCDVGFLEGLEKLVQKQAKYISTLLTLNLRSSTEIKPQLELKNSLQSNLSNPSHLVRSVSLRILQSLVAVDQHSSELVNAMLSIETTPRTVENVRSTSIAMRKLPQLSSPENDEMLVHFCFGSLTVNFAPLWNDACSVLKAVSDRSGSVVWRIALAGLRSEKADPAVLVDKTLQSTVEETENIRVLADRIWRAVEQNLDETLEFLLEQSLARSKPDGTLSPRSQSLRALMELPQLAEQHSRDLVPIFLSLETVPENTTLHWPRKDRVAVLTLFTKFVNPRALYKTDLVRTTLYTLLHNGDSKIQTLALDAILTWKEVELVTYKESLHNLLDETKFREELTSLVHVDANDSPVQEEHRRPLMEVVLRILFGNALVRHSSGENKRAAILSTLMNLRANERAIFMDLVLLPFQSNIGSIKRRNTGLFVDEAKVSVKVDDRKMVGFLAMVQHLVKALAEAITPYLPLLLEALIVCMWKSRLAPSEDEMNDEDSEADAHQDFLSANTKLARTIRRSSMKALTMSIEGCPEFDWKPYVFLIYEHFISPRLSSLPDENIQSPSNALRLLETLSEQQNTVGLLSQLDCTVFPTILRCMGNPSANVMIFDSVLRIILNIFKFSEARHDSLSLPAEIVLPNLSDILHRITLILTDDRFRNVISNKNTLDLVTEVLRFCAPLAQTADQAEKLIEPLLSLTGKPAKFVNEKTKIGVIESVQNLLPLCGDFSPNFPSFKMRLSSVSRLFSMLNSRVARVHLCEIINIFAEADSSLHGVGELVKNLNAFDLRRLDTPDFEKRLAAYAKLNEEIYQTLNSVAWTPIVYNLLYYVQDPEEMSLRTGAAFGLERFFTIAGERQLTLDFVELLSHAILPVIKKNIKNPIESIRTEYSGVLDSLVKHCGHWQPISDLKVLLFDGDEEANFFHNIYHIQQHRRLRAITRLSKVVLDGAIKSTNIEEIFIPMLENFSMKAVEENHNLAAEAIRGIGILSGGLGWKAYRQLVKRYLGVLKSGHEKERVVVRTICAIVEMAGKVAETRKQRLRHMEGAEEMDYVTEGPAESEDFLARVVVNEFYPPMLKYLHQHEESTLSLRVPVAIALVKILKALPVSYLNTKLPAVLTDVCHILRSRSQEARDTCRKTLNEIIGLLGPEFLSFILKELKSALFRGYQLHVLGYTLHSLLVHLSPNFGELDTCTKQIVDLLVDDIFGVTGAEKESEGYINNMKEIRTSKSYDSFEILASVASVESLGLVLQPLKSMLYDLATTKETRKMIEVLRRIELGLLRSKGTESGRLFDFCLSFFKHVQSELISSSQPSEVRPANQFIVDLKFKRKYEISHFRANAPIVLRFSLNTMAALSKKTESLLNPERMTALIPILGDCLMSDTDELRIASLRLLGRMISQPIAAVEEGLEVFVDRAVQFVKESPLTKSELCQASIKFLTVLIRNRKSFSPPETVVVYIFERIRPDLEEPDRQGVSFSFIRSILSRRVLVPEVYDIMLEIARIMITNQSRSVRDTTRALYLQFLMDYPQGRDRLKKEISFLVKNLQYEHDTGRQSVMEVLHQIISKFGDELLQPILLDLFVGLLLPLANDDNVTCREMASKLIQSLIESADEERSRAIREMLRTWASQNDKPALLKASLHIYRILLEHGNTTGDDDVALCLDTVNEIMLSSKEDRVTNDIQWEVSEQALQLLARLIRTVSSKLFTTERSDLWVAIRQILLSKHLGVRLTAAQIIGCLFGRGESLENGQLKVENLYLHISDLVDFTRQFLEQVKDNASTLEIGLQAVKNLIFLGRHFYETRCLLSLSQRSNKGQAASKPCLTWLISRVAAEIKFEHVVAEVSCPCI